MKSATLTVDICWVSVCWTESCPMRFAKDSLTNNSSPAMLTRARQSEILRIIAIQLADRFVFMFTLYPDNCWGC